MTFEKESTTEKHCSVVNRGGFKRGLQNSQGLYVHRYIHILNFAAKQSEKFLTEWQHLPAIAYCEIITQRHCPHRNYSPATFFYINPIK